MAVAVKVSGIDQSSSFGTHSECNTQKFDRTDASFFFFLHFKGVIASPKRNSDSEGTFFKVWY